MVSHAEHDASKFIPNDSATLRLVTRDLASQYHRLSATAFEELETLKGWRYSPESVLQDPELVNTADISQNYFDWVHCWLAHGLSNVQIALAMHALQAHGIAYKDLFAYAKKWRPPSAFCENESSWCEALGPTRAKGSWKA